MSFFDFIPVIGDLIGAGASIANNKSTNETNERINERTIAAQKEMQTTQNDWNLAQWNRQNEYNSPVNQVSLYEEAGLNPAFYLGQGNSTAGAVQSSVMSAPSQIPMQANTQIGDILSKMGMDFEQAMLLDSQRKLLDSQRGLTDTESEFNRLTMESRVHYQSLINGLTQEQQNKVQEETNALRTTQAYQRSLIGLNENQLEQQKIVLGYLPLMKYAELRQAEASIENTLASAELSRGKVRYYKSMLGLIHEQIQTERMRQYDIFTHASVNETQADVNRAESGLIQSEEDRNRLQNEVTDSTKETAKFRQNVENVLSPFLDAIDRVASSYGNFAKGRSLIGKPKTSTNNPTYSKPPYKARTVRTEY